jgi:AAA15 family ATPase/GTPase
MLKQLRIQNFKGWKDTGTIRMAPISLFFGANSSGKSSIGQFLMMLKQTVESPDRKAVFYPGGKNSAAQLGSFQDMVFHHDIKSKISFNYQWLLEQELKVKDALSGNTFTGNEIEFQATVCSDEKSSRSLMVMDFIYRLYSEKNLTLSLCFEKENEGNGGYRAKAEKYNLVRQQGRPWSFKAPKRVYGFTTRTLILPRIWC